MNNANSELVFFDAKLKEEREYWLQKLSFELIASSPPPDYPRPFDSEPVYAELISLVPNDTERRLRCLVGNSPFLLYTVLVAALKICLYKYTGHDTILVGSPSLKELNRRNALALADHLEPAASFQQLLLSVRENLLEAYSRQRYSFSRLLKDLGLEEIKHKCPLFDVALQLEGLHGELPDVDTDVVFSFRQSGDQLTCLSSYNEAIYAPETIQRFIEHFFNALQQGVAAPEKQLCEISLMSPAEREQVLVRWNETARNFGAENYLHRLFEAQVERTPNAPAVSLEQESLTYRELNEKANQLAHHLQRLGVGPETLVCICMERSLEMVISILGVLKAGGAYVPLDPEYPRERLAFMFADVRAPVLLTQAKLSPALPTFDGAVIEVDTKWSTIASDEKANLASLVPEDSLAYVIYTSGSTGRAKGVMISHRAICNRLLWMQDKYQFIPADKLLQKTPFTFDASVWEFFVPWMAGAHLVMARPGGHREPGYLVDTVIAEEITVVQLVPSMLQVYLDESAAENCHSLKHLFCGGESLPMQLQERFYARSSASLHNLYGPTEVSIDASFWDCVAGDKRRHVPIGGPIANMQLFVLDEQMQPAPVGVVGELYIAGVGLGRGYWNRPDLTAEKFVPHPLSRRSGERLYRSGDLVICHPDKSFEYVGRVDNQVKIRGFRIELGEVELELAAHADVHEVVVLAREDAPTDKRLVAYVVPVMGAELSAATLRSHLRTMLPEYMVPASFVILERLPLHSNGKLNRKALPAPDREAIESDDALVMPRTAIEEILANIWAEVLGLERVGIHNDFFDLGGHSLLATQVVSRTREAFNVELPLRVFFESPTVAKLGESIEAACHGNLELESLPAKRVPRDGDLLLSFTQRRLLLLDQLDARSATFNLLSALRLSGPLDERALAATLTEIVRRHEALRTTFAIRADEVVQVIGPAQRVDLPVTDLSQLSTAEQEVEVRAQALADSERPFDLWKGPLLRARLLRLREREHVLLFTVHHIVSDGWSMGRLVHEVSVLYSACREGRPSPLPDLTIQYADYAVWQREWLHGDRLESQIAYWREQLDGIPTTLNLPTDHPRPAIETHHGANDWFYLPPELSSGLKKLCREEGVTLFMLLLAAWQTLLHRYTGQDDVLVGSPVANRLRPEFEPLIGCLINTLVFRGHLAGNPTFKEFLRRVREVALGAYAHQDVPLDLLVETLQPERQANYNPFFQVMFVLQNAPMKALQLADLMLSPVHFESTRTQCDLILAAVESQGQLKGTLTYNTDIFEAETISEMLQRFRRLLEEIVADPTQRLLDVPIGEIEPVAFRSEVSSIPASVKDHFAF